MADPAQLPTPNPDSLPRRVLHATRALLVALAIVSCEEARPAPAGYAAAPGGSRDAGTELELDGGSNQHGPPSGDASGFCGNQRIAQVIERPNVYFVVDRSGSMADAPEGEPRTKYESVRLALREVLSQVGHRVRYGAAVFPSRSADDDCAPGAEVFPTREGDPVAYALRGELGPTLLELLTVLSRFPSQGSTPIDATLRALAPSLQALRGETVVILATDGEPNCGEFDYCEPADCQLVRDRYVLTNGWICANDLNCCDPEVVTNGPQFCVDDVSTQATLHELAEAGIHTYVIGLPGSEASADVLNALARAGAAQVGLEGPDPASYYPVRSAEELSATLRSITTSVSIDCHIDLEAEPPVPSEVNVYFDGVVIPADSKDGWQLQGEQQIQIKGEACRRLRGGDVYEVHIVAGCPTVVL